MSDRGNKATSPASRNYYAHWAMIAFGIPLLVAVLYWLIRVN
jgi:hypothetical protein